MGCGESVYVKQQEEFVRENRANFKSKLPGYSQTQIDCKLRQLYSKSDCSAENSRSYINSSDWNRAKSSVVISGKQLY